MSDLPAIYALDSCDSVLNEVRHLFASGRLPVFASVITRKQTAGRGQHGHSWDSPEGNLYAAIRLPLEAPFLGITGPIAVSTFIAEALNELGVTVKIKWPNDIAIPTKDNGWAKCGGILLEKKGMLLTAGIGINVASHPSTSLLREGAALPAGALSEILATPLEPEDLWRTIVRRFVMSSKEAFCRNWPSATLPRMLWLNNQVLLAHANGSTVRGIFSGLSPAGEILLNTDTGLRAFAEGSLRSA